MKRERQRERLHEAVGWWEGEYGAVTGQEPAEAGTEAEAEREERVRNGLDSPGAAA